LLNEITKTKKQHYIPQFLLRNWSDDKKHINGIRFNDDRTVKTVRQSISDSFVVSYLYGKSRVFEDELFANTLEPNFKDAIDEIRTKKKTHDKRIQEYILYQMCRTKFIVDLCIYNEEAMAEYCFDEDKARKVGISKEDLKFLIEDKYGQNIGYKDALETIVLPSIKPFICSLRKQKLGGDLQSMIERE
jgi:hypothetical protein